jgi:hypothetical protein
MTMTTNKAPKGQDAPERIWLEAAPQFPAKIPPFPSWNYDEADPSMNQTLEYTRADLLATAQARAEQAEAEVARLREWLEGIRQYGSDTLAGPSRDPSGSAFVPDDRKWHREAVLKMTLRARYALDGHTPDWTARAALREGGKDTGQKGDA